eukprot:jgi/Mesvir1/12158/Mv00405-RA.1
MNMVAATGASWFPLANPLSEVSALLSPRVEIIQRLNAEGLAAYVVGYSEMSDGAITELGRPDGLVISDVPGLDEPSDGDLRYVVPVGASSSCNVFTGRWVSCRGTTIVTGTGVILVDLAAAVSISVSVSVTRITREGDPAQSPPISLPTSSTLRVTVLFADGRVVEYTRDPRTSYTVNPGAAFLEVAQSGGNVIARAVNGSTGFGPATITILSCTGVFQRATAVVTAVLSDNATVEVTSNSQLTTGNATVIELQGPRLIGLSPGTVNIDAVFSRVSAPTLSMTVTLEAANATAVEITTTFPLDTFKGIVNSTRLLDARLFFDDGTRFDSVQAVGFIPVSSLLSFTSSDVARVSVDANGLATLHDNHAPLTYVTLTAQVACGSSVNDTIDIIPNLDAALGDVDLVELTFDTAIVAAQRCEKGSDWSGIFECTLNDPPNRALFLGSLDSSTARGPELTVGRMTMRGISAGISPLSGVIQVMIRADGNETVPKVVFAGAGFIPILSAPGVLPRALLESGLLALAPRDLPENSKSSLARRSLVEAVDLRNFEGCSVFGDTSADGLADATDVLQLQYYLNKVVNPTGCALQMMNPTQTGRAVPGDIVYLARFAARKFRWLVTVNVDVPITATNSELVIYVDIANTTSQPALPAQTRIRFEMNSRLNSRMVFSEGQSLVLPGSAGQVVQAAHNDSQPGRYRILARPPPGPGFVTEEIGLGVIIETFDQNGADARDRKFVFQGSSIPPFNESPGGFVPFILTLDLLPEEYTFVPPFRPTTLFYTVYIPYGGGENVSLAATFDACVGTAYFTTNLDPDTRVTMLNATRYFFTVTTNQLIVSITVIGEDFRARQTYTIVFDIQQVQDAAGLFRVRAEGLDAQKRVLAGEPTYWFMDLNVGEWERRFPRIPVSQFPLINFTYYLILPNGTIERLGKVDTGGPNKTVIPLPAVPVINISGIYQVFVEEDITLIELDGDRAFTVIASYMVPEKSELVVRPVYFADDVFFTIIGRDRFGNQVDGNNRLGHRPPVFVDEVTSVTITAYDILGFRITTGGDAAAFAVQVSLLPPLSGRLVVTITDNGDGTYTASFVPPLVGEYRLTVEVNGFLISSQVFTAIERREIPDLFILAGPGLQGGRTGRPLTFYILLEDGFVSPLVPDLFWNETRIPVVRDPDSLLLTGIVGGNLTRVSGTYTVNATLEGAHIRNSPAKVLVVAERPYYNYSVIIKPDRLVYLAGETIIVRMDLRDIYNNVAQPFPGEVVVTFEGSEDSRRREAAVLRDADGWYASIALGIVQNYTVVGTLLGQVLSGSGFQVQVVPGNASAPNALVQGSGILDSFVGANVVVFYDFEFVFAEGRWALRYTHEDSGDFVVTVNITDRAGVTDVRTYDISVTAGEPNAFRLVEPVPIGTAGVRGTFQFQLLSNTSIVFDPYQLEVTMVGPGGTELFAVPTGVGLQISGPSELGIYTVSYLTLVSGNYSVSVFANGIPLVPSAPPATVTVVAGPPSPLTSTAFGSGLANSTAGQELVIYVVARDAFGNLVTVDYGTLFALIQVGANDSDLLPTDISFDPATGTYTIRYTAPTVTGALVITVGFGNDTLNVDNYLPGFPLVAFVNPGVPDPNRFLVIGPGYVGAVPGQRAHFWILLFDSFGNRITDGGYDIFATIYGSDPRVLLGDIAVVDGRNGRYDVYYSLTREGNYTLTAFYEGMVITRWFPTTIIVTRDIGPFEPGRSLVDFEPEVEAGTVNTITIIAVSAKGIQMNDSSVPAGGFTVTFTGPPGSGIDRREAAVRVGDGTWTLVYNETLAGRFVIDVNVTDTGVRIGQPSDYIALPAPLLVYPSRTDASKSGYARDWPPSTPAGVAITAVIQARDRFGNAQVYDPRRLLQDDWLVEAQHQVRMPVVITGLTRVLDRAAGTSLATLTLFVAGKYDVVVSLRDVLLGNGTPSVVQVTAGVVDPGLTTVEGLPGTVIAGTNVTFTIRPVDSYGNIITGDLDCQVTITPISGSGVPVNATCRPSIECIDDDPSNDDDCRLIVDFVINIVGQYNITVTLGGVTVVDTVIRVIPAELDPSRSTAVIPDTVFVNEVFNFTIIARDHFGNQLTSGGANVAITILGEDFVGKPIQIIDNGDGTYTVIAVIRDPGLATIDIRLDGVPIAGSPYPINVLVSVTDGSNSYALGFGLEETVAGYVSEFVIQSVDASGAFTREVNDRFTLVFSPGPGLDLPPRVLGVVPNGDGTYNASYITYRRPLGDAYILQVYLSNPGANQSVPLRNSPYRISWLPGDIDVNLTTITPTDIVAGVGEDARYSILPRDIFNNTGRFDNKRPPLAVDLLVDGPVEGPSAVDPAIRAFAFNRRTGSYTGTFRAHAVGTYDIETIFDGIPSPTHVTVRLLPGANDLTKFLAFGQGISEPAIAGEPMLFFILPRDEFGNPSRDGGSLSGAIRTGTTMQLQLEREGGLGLAPLDRPSISFNVTTRLYEGRYTVDRTGTLLTDIVIQNSRIETSPYEQPVLAGPPVAFMSDISGPGMLATLRNEVSTYFLTVRDRLRNLYLRPLPTNALSVNYTNVATPSMRAPDFIRVLVPVYNADGTYTLQYRVIHPSMPTLRMNVMLYGEDVGRSPATVSVRDINVGISPENSIAYGPGLSTGSVGVETYFTVILVDFNHVAYAESQGDIVRFQFYPANGSPDNSSWIYCHDNENGTYTCRYAPDIVGDARIIIDIEGFGTLGGAGHTFVLKLLSGPTDPNNSYLYLDGTFIAGDRVLATVVLRDAAGNEVDCGVAEDDNVMVVVSGPEVLEVDVVRQAYTASDGRQVCRLLATFLPELMGDYYIEARIRNNATGGVFVPVNGTNQFQIFPSRYDLTRTVVGGSIHETLAGLTTPFYVRLFDRFGNQILSPLVPGAANGTTIAVTGYFAALDGSGTRFALDQIIHWDGDRSEWVGSFNAPYAGQWILALFVDGTRLTIKGYVTTTVTAGLIEPRPVDRGNLFEVFVRPKTTATGGFLRATRIVDNDDGTYIVTYVPLGLREHEVFTRWNHEEVAKSPYLVSYESGLTSPEDCVAYGRGLVSGVAGASQSVFVQAYDAFESFKTNGEDKFEYFIVGTRGEISEGILSVINSTGEYTTSYVYLKTGAVHVDITLRGQRVNPGVIPATAQVTPAAIWPPSCVISGGGLTRAVAGEDERLTIRSRDRYDNNLATGDAVFSFVIQAAETGEVVRELEPAYVTAGVYNVRYQLEAAGGYVTETRVLEEIIRDGRSSLEVSPAEPSALQSSLQGFALQSFPVDVPASFHVVVADVYGNLRANASDVTPTNLAVLLAPSDGASPEVTLPVTVAFDGDGGSHLVSFTPTAPGALRVRLTLGALGRAQEVLAGSGRRFQATAVVTDPDPNQVVVFGAGATAAAGGTPAYLRVKLRDKHGNDITQTQALPPQAVRVQFEVVRDPENLTATAGVVAPADVVAEVAAQESAYVARYVPAVSPRGADYQLLATVLYNGVAVAGSPQVVTVYSTVGAVADAGNSVVLDARRRPLDALEIEGSPAGGPTSFWVQGRDVNGVDLPVTNYTLSVLIPSAATGAGGSGDEDGERAIISITPSLRGMYSVTVTLPRVGRYSVLVFVDGVRIPDVVTLIIPPGPADPTQVLVENVADAFAGARSAPFLIRSRDSRGNFVSYSPLAGADPYLVQLRFADSGQQSSQATIEVTDNRDGTYTGRYLTTLAGEYVLQISLNGVAQRFPVTVATGPFFGLTSNLAGVPEAATAGVEGVFVIEPRDAYENLYRKPDLVFFVIFRSVTPASGNSSSGGGADSIMRTHVPRVAVTSDIRYVVTFRFAYVADYNISATEIVRDQDVAVPPGTLITVEAGAPSGALSTVTGLTDGSAGDARVFYITPRDGLGNAIPLSRVRVGLSILGLTPRADESVSTVVTQAGDGTRFAVAFRAVGVGSYLVRASLSGVALPERVISRVPRPPPVLDSCQISDNLIELVATFDEATNQAGMGDAQFDCSLVLSDATVANLGLDPFCSWDTPTRLVIRSGYSPSFLPRLLTTVRDEELGRLRLRDGRVYSAAQNSIAARGSRGIDFPEDGEYPNLVVTAPLVVGRCDGAVLEFSSVTGRVGRPPRLRVRAFGTGATVPRLDRFLQNVDARATSIPIPVSLLEPGMTFVISWTIRNYVQLEVTDDLSFSQSVLPLPTVVIEEGDGRAVLHRADNVTLESRILLPSASCLDPSFLTNFATDGLFINWVQQDGIPLDFSAVTLASSRSSLQLRLPDTSLYFGRGYEFSVRTHPLSNFGLASRSVFPMSVQPTAIQLELVGGSARTAPGDVDLVLEVRALDPDNSIDLIDRYLLFYYEWRCDIISKSRGKILPGRTSCFSDNTGILFTNTPRITVPAFTLLAGVYQFSVMVGKEPVRLAEGRVEVIKQRVVVPTVAPPGVWIQRRIEATDGELLFVRDSVLECVTSARNASFQWFRLDNSVRYALPLPDTQDHLSVSNAMLASEANFTFECIVTDRDTGRQGYSTYDIAGNAPPTGGRLKVSPSFGTQYVTEFSITAYDWEDDRMDQPLAYAFYAIAGNDTTLLAQGASPTISTMLPAGVVTLLVTVTDRRDAQSVAVLPDEVVVTPFVAGGVNFGRRRALLEDVASGHEGAALSSLLPLSSATAVTSSWMSSLTSSSSTSSLASLSSSSSSSSWSPAAAASAAAAAAAVVGHRSVSRHTGQGQLTHLGGRRSLLQSPGGDSTGGGHGAGVLGTVTSRDAAAATALLARFQQLVRVRRLDAAATLVRLWGQEYGGWPASTSSTPGDDKTYNTSGDMTPWKRPDCSGGQDQFRAAKDALVEGLWELSGVTWPDTYDSSQLVCAVASLGAIAGEMSAGSWEKAVDLAWRRRLDRMVGPTPELFLLGGQPECYSSIMSTAAEAVEGNCGALEERDTPTLKAAWDMMGDLSEAVLTWVKKGEPPTVIEEPWLRIVAGKVATNRFSSAADFNSTLYNMTAALHITDGGVPHGTDVDVFLYAFRNINPRPPVDQGRLIGNPTAVGSRWLGRRLEADIPLVTFRNVSLRELISGETVNMRYWPIGGPDWLRSENISSSFDQSALILTASFNYSQVSDGVAPYIEPPPPSPPPPAPPPTPPTPPPPPPPAPLTPPKDRGLRGGAVAGTVIGFVVGLLIAITAIVLYLRKRRQRQLIHNEQLPDIATSTSPIGLAGPRALMVPLMNLSGRFSQYAPSEYGIPESLTPRSEMDAYVSGPPGARDVLAPAALDQIDFDLPPEFEVDNVNYPTYALPPPVAGTRTARVEPVAQEELFSDDAPTYALPPPIGGATRLLRGQGQEDGAGRSPV